MLKKRFRLIKLLQLLRDKENNAKQDMLTEITGIQKSGAGQAINQVIGTYEQSEVAKLNVEDFTVLGIKELLTIQRQNGLGHLLDRIIKIANELY